MTNPDLEAVSFGPLPIDGGPEVTLARSPGNVRSIAVSLVIGAGVLALFIWQRDRLSGLPELLSHANWAWIAVAIALQGGSVGFLARLQRRLLNVDGLHHRLGPILATTYAGNAIAQSLPVVGSAASAVFAYKRFLTIGADKMVATWALAVAGLYSTISFVSISAVGALLSGSVGLAAAGLVTLFAGVVPMIAVLVGLQRPGIRRMVVRALGWALRVSQRVLHRQVGDPSATADAAIGKIAGLHLPRRDALMAGRFAVGNWVLDIACLAAALAAIGAPIPWAGLVLAWAAGASASSLRLTPGGLGVVEAALSVALIAAGLPAGIAVSGVLLYRFIKLWLVLAAGFVTLLVLRSRTTRA